VNLTNTDTEYILRQRIAQLEKALAALKAEVRRVAIEECVQRIATGRTAVNFGHVPSVSRALDWLIVELRELADPPAVEGDTDV
jgi:hypothetical protein